jgi:alanine racemase
MSRPARALLDPQALRHNFEVVRQRAPRARIMAVVKANAYGHGLAWVASELSEADAFGVSSIEEGLVLRRAGVRQPICLLEGFFSADEIPLLIQHRLNPAIHHESQLAMIESARLGEALDVWIKIDSGMHRIGFRPDAFASVCARLSRCPGIGAIRVMSHLASADDRDNSATRQQIDSFLALTRESGLERSLANSAGIAAWQDSHLDWVRPGIMLYGAAPVSGSGAPDLKPVMTLTTALIAVHVRRKGETIGYGGDYRCPEDMPVGVATIGYGDGYPRHARPGTPVLLNGQRVPLIGRVSMDMITLDLRTQSRARTGDPVVLWGRGLAVDEVAANAGTISYELLCHVTERIPRVAVSENKLKTVTADERR